MMDEVWANSNSHSWAPPERPFDWLLCVAIFLGTVVLLGFTWRKGWAAGRSRFLCLILPILFGLLATFVLMPMEQTPLLLLKVALLVSPVGLVIGLKKSPERLGAVVLSGLSLASAALMFLVLPTPPSSEGRRLVSRMQTRDLIRQTYGNYYCSHKRWPKDWDGLTGSKGLQSVSLDEYADIENVTQAPAGAGLQVTITFGPKSESHYHVDLKPTDFQCKQGRAVNALTGGPF